MDKQRYYLDGPGEVLVVASDYNSATPVADKIFAVITCKSAAINTTSTFEKVTGGRSFSPKRKFLTEKTVTLELEDCEMDFRYVALSQGADIATGAVDAWAFGSDEKYTVGATTTNVINLKNTPKAGTLTFKDESGNIFTEAATPLAGSKFSRATTVVTFDAADNAKVMYGSYQYTTEATTKSIGVLVDAVPKTVKIIHNMPMFDNTNKVVGTQQIEMYLCEVSPEFAEDYREKTPASAKLSFEILDPQRSDKKLMDRRLIYKSA